MPLIMDPPPPTPVDPVTDVLHGVPVTDPYRWLEDQNCPKTRKWLEEQNAYARSYLDAIPGRDRIGKCVEELLAVEVISEPWKIGNRYFYLKRSPYQEQAAIMMRDGDSGDDVVLVDPTQQANSSRTAVKIINVSGDGKLVAYSVSETADAFSTVEFLDVDRKQVLPDKLAHSFNVQLLYSGDGRGFYYSSEVRDTAHPHYRAVYWHAFGTTPQKDREVFFGGENPNTHLRLLESTSCQLLGYLVAHTNDHTTVDFYLQDGLCRKPPRKLLEELECVFQPFFVGEQLFALTDWKAPNFRIVAIDPDYPGQDHWLDLIPESQYRIKDFAFVGHSIYIAYVRDCSCQIEKFDRTGRWHGVIPCPSRGTVRFLWHPSENETLLYHFSSFDHRPTIFSCDVSSDDQKVWAGDSGIDNSAFEVEQVRYRSKDGTEIPMFLVARKGQRLSGPLPTFLGAYGGFGSSRTPRFNAYSTFLIEHGFLFAFANLRGGGEFGNEWHRAAKRRHRQTAFDDFIAAAEWLIAQGHAAPGQIAIGGGSNGGLLTGAALTQRPDLFRVAVCLGPLLDMLRYHRFDFAQLFGDEFGTSDREDDFAHLRAYSPYQRVEDGVSYPAVMLVSGDEDTCCNPMHVRKMTARLQAATSSGHPILLDYKQKWGHAPVQPLSQRIVALTDRLAFICHELGVRV